MKLKKMLAGFMTLCMMATAVPVTALAEEAVAKIGEETYTSLASALEAAEEMTGDVTITLTGDVEWETGAGHGSTPLIGKDSGVESVTIDGQEEYTLTATGAGVGSLRAANGGKLVFKGLYIDDKSESYAEDSWEFTYLEFAGNLEFNRCAILSGISLDTDNGQAEGVNAKFVDCAFESKEESVYCVWIGHGDVTFEGCSFTGTRGAKIHEAYGSEVDSVTFDDCAFRKLTKKPGLAIGDLNKATVVTIKDCVFDGVKAGDQGKFIYESDTDVSKFDFNLESNAVLVENAVAEVDGVQYTTLAEAVEAAESGEEVTLLKDAKGSGIVINKNITIDFDGNTYDIIGSAVGSKGTTTLGFQILSSNTVTLKDGTITESAPEQNGEGKTNEAVKMLVQNYSNLTLENMVLDGSELGGEGRYTLSNNCGTVEITGKTKIIADDNKGIALDACEYASYAVPTVTIGKDCVVDGKLEVTGDANLVIEGGTYTDLANAVKYAEGGAEIALLEDAEGAGIVIDKDITIDFDKHTYNIVGPAVGSAGTTTLGFQILSGNTVTLKDGTITESAPEQNGEGKTNEAVKMLVQNYSNLTLEDMVLDGRGLGDGRYVLSNNCGNITITGETEIIAPAVEGIAFDVCKFGSYDAPTVTFDAGFKGGAKGAFEVSEGLEGNLKIHAGYFTQDPTAYVVEGKEVKVIDKDGYKYMVGDPVIDPTPSTSSSKKSSKKYSVEIEDTEDGTVKASSTRVKKDATVTLTVTPDEGYELDDLVVLDKDGEKVKLKDKGNGKYTFTMPRGGVEVEASFVEKEGEKEPVATEKEFIKLTIGQKIVWIFDEYVVNDVAPEIKNDRTMLPIRIIAEALGAKVTWNEAEQKVTIAEDDLTIEIFIGQPFATVNGKPVQLDAPAYIANDRTYLPLRFVAENLGATVEWNAADSSVTIFK